LGLSAVPFPKKIRRTLPGCQATADALGDTTAAPKIGSPLLTAAAAGTVRSVPPNSRRAAANVVHINGAAPGSPAPPPAPNQANTSAPTPLTPPEAAAARGAALITGADATGTAASSDEPDDRTIDDGGMTEPGSTSALPAGDAIAGVGSGKPLSSSSPDTGVAPALPDSDESACGRTSLVGRGLATTGTEESLFNESGTEISSATGPAAEPRVLDARDEPPTDSRAEPPRPREVPRDGAFADGAAPDDESAALAPFESAEPVVSADAVGIAATAAPTPKATANAPTRPTASARGFERRWRTGRKDAVVATESPLLVDRCGRVSAFAQRPYAAGTASEISRTTAFSR